MLPNSSMHVWRLSTWLANPVMVRHLISPEWLEEMSYDSDSKGDVILAPGAHGPQMRMLQPERSLEALSGDLFLCCHGIGKDYAASKQR